MKENTVRFFSSPLDSKRTVAVREKGFEGFGHHYSRADDKLDWAESCILITQPVEARNTEMWPTDPPTFKSVVHSIHSIVPIL
jgi:hypothetical protein